MWILGLIILFLLLLLFLPLTAEIRYQKQWFITLRYLFFHCSLLPQDASNMESKTKKKSKKKGKFKKARKDEEKNAEEKAESDSLFSMLDLIKQALSSLKNPLGWFLRKIRYRNIKLDWVICQEDAHLTALRYGQANAMVYTVLSLLKNCMDMDSAKLNIRADFVGEEGQVSGQVHIKLRPLYALIFVLWFAARFVYTYVKEQSSEKSAQKASKQQAGEKETPVDTTEKSN